MEKLTGCFQQEQHRRLLYQPNPHGLALAEKSNRERKLVSVAYERPTLRPVAAKPVDLRNYALSSEAASVPEESANLSRVVLAITI